MEHIKNFQENNVSLFPSTVIYYRIFIKLQNFDFMSHVFVLSITEKDCKKLPCLKPTNRILTEILSHVIFQVSKLTCRFKR